VYSEPGIGTTFRMYLPLAGVHIQGSGSSALLPEGKGETVLIADDDPGVRKITASILEQFGYQVLQAGDGEDTLRQTKQHDGPIHLVLLDVIMPKTDARRLAEEIRRSVPSVRILFTSGYTADFIVSKGLLDEGVPVVTKPVSPKDLLRKIREVLES
jgi:DNA-binding response OmpR family regulator